MNEVSDSGWKRLFVYGTLLRGEPNHAELEEARFVGEARTAARYDLEDLGLYPGLVEGTHSVEGELYEVSEAILHDVDAFEGVEYRRAEVELEDGVALSYLLRRSGGYPKIPSGSWRRRSSKTES